MQTTTTRRRFFGLLGGGGAAAMLMRRTAHAADGTTGYSGHSPMSVNEYERRAFQQNQDATHRAGRAGQATSERRRGTDGRMEDSSQRDDD